MSDTLFMLISFDVFLKQVLLPVNLAHCWEWAGSYYCVNGRPPYRFWVPVLPKGMIVRHLCHNPKCVNPLHLRVGTQSENGRDTWIRNICAKEHNCSLPRNRFGGVSFGASRKCGECPHNELLKGCKTWSLF